MIVTTGETIPGHQVSKILGVARGNTIRARHVGRDIMAGLRSIVGGEITDYTKMIAESREQSLDRLIAAAKELDADAIICMRFSTSYVMSTAAEILAYGTAVKTVRK
ncbi:YbjQ family protein [candidate division KSB1 bacterium]